MSRLLRTGRTLVALPLLLGCSSLLTLNELEKADCVSADCYGGAAGTRSYKGSGGASAGSSASAGRGGAPAVAGSGGSSEGGKNGEMNMAGTATAGGNSGGFGLVGGSGGNAGSSGGGGDVGSAGTAASGGSAGNPSGGSAGAASGGAAGQPGLGGCQPSATDQSCDGLDAVCNPTDSDVACNAFCLGSFVDGASYMSCVDAASFDQAAAACAQNGMRLVRIDSEQENQTVWSIALDDYVWLGGTNRDDQNTWIWPDGTPFLIGGAAVGDTYESFPPGQPADDPDYRCAEMDANGWWSNWFCDEAQSYVCKRY